MHAIGRWRRCRRVFDSEASHSLVFLLVSHYVITFSYSEFFAIHIDSELGWSVRLLLSLHQPLY